MASVIRTYLVVSGLPVVVTEAGGGSLSYAPGAIFESPDTNPSVIRLLEQEKIIESLASPQQGSFAVTQGPTGATGPIGPTGPAGASGEINTASNAGGDEGLALTKAGVDLPFKGLTAGANITLTPTATDVTIDATVLPPEDENNVVSNQVFR